MLRTGSAIRLLSVISSTSDDGGTSAPRSSSATCSGSSSPSARAERFTAMVRSRPWRAQVPHWWIAAARVQRVSERISPVCSASGMNSSGGTKPISGLHQRRSASTPTIRPSPRAALGW